MASDKPNILLVVIDCLRADRVFDADRRAHTPNLDALAQRGTLFSHLITANSMTIPCMTTLFSGMYPNKHGVRAMIGARVGDHVPLLAEILRANGYNTYAEATGPLSAFYRLNRGFDYYELRDGVKSSLLGGWGDQLIARFRRKEFVTPWFIYLHLWGVHRPRQILPQFNTPAYGKTAYDRAISSYDFRLGELFAALDEQTVVVVTGDHGEKIPENRVESRVEFLKKSLTGSVSNNTAKGAWVKRRRKAIAALRRSWFTAARLLHRARLLHSPLASLTGHGYHVYDSLVRVPLVVAGSGTPSAGQVISAQVRQVDIMPTILDLAGLASEIPETADGRSLAPSMRGDPHPPLPAFIETCQNSREPSTFYGVRYQGWKYACDMRSSSVPEELYDLAADPQETRNLAKELSQRATEMRQLIEQHLRPGQQSAVSMAEALSESEITGLTEHLKQLGYVE
jgi:arylsulfatase A-like enzyme